MPNRIREVRKQHNMTMKQLGIKIGVAESTISQYETGKRQPDNEALLRIGELFNVTVGYLLGAEDKENPATKRDEVQKAVSNYDLLNDENKAIIDQMIEKLIKSQSGD